jgi:hypothetical protein
MSKLEFFKKHKILFQLVQLDKNKKLIGPIESKPPYLPTCNDSVALISERMRNQIIVKNDTVSLKLNENIMVIDVDLYEPTDKKYKGELSQEATNWIESLKLTCPYSVSTRKKRGLHIYFKPSPSQLEFLNSKMKHGDYPYPQIEILSKCLCYEDLGKKINNSNINIMEVKIPQVNKIQMYINKVKPEISRVPPELVVSRVPPELVVSRVPKCIAKLTHTTSDYEYPKWLKILTLLKSEGEEFKEIGREWSKKSNRYETDDNFNKHWNYANIKYVKKTKISKPAVTQKIYLDFYELFEGNYIINIDEGSPSYYIYDENVALWKSDNKMVLLKVKILQLLIIKYKKQLLVTTDMEVIDEINKKLDKVQTINSGGIVDIAKLFILKTKETFSNNVKFDDREDLFHFMERGMTLDLTTLEFIERKKEHYATMTGCSLKPMTNPNNKKIWKTIIEETFPNKDERLNWLQIMCNSLSGRVLEKFLVQNGGGSNGKSLLNDIFRYLHKDYGFKGNVSILTKKLSDGGNPAIANMSKKRFCVFDEPSEQDTLEFSVIKAISGGSEISARKLYSNEDCCVMAGIKVLECNEKLKIDGDSGYSMIRRLIDFHYSATFMAESDKPTNWKELGIKTAVPLYKTKEWLKHNISNFVYYLIDIMKENEWDFLKMDNIKLCDSVKNRTNSYIDSSNDIYQTILTFCEYTASESDVLLIKSIHNKYTQSNEWNNLTKKQKRLLSLNKWKSLVETNHKLKTFYKKNVEGSKASGWLTCYKFKRCFCDDSDDDE